MVAKNESTSKWIDTSRLHPRIQTLAEKISGQKATHPTENATMAQKMCGSMMHGCKYSKSHNKFIPDEAVCSGPNLKLTHEGCKVQDTICPKGTTYDADKSQCMLNDDICPSGLLFNSSEGKCVMDTANLCGNGTHWDESAKHCIIDTNLCGNGTHWDETAKNCIMDTNLCGNGTHWDETENRCMITCNKNEIWDDKNMKCVVKT